MSRRLPCSLLAVALGLLPAPALAARLGPEALASALDRQMRHAGPGGAALVVDLDSGRVLYALRPDAERVPASLEKLFTTAAALLRLGPAATLDTTVLGPAPGPDGTLSGDLVVRGSGDPTLDRAGLARLAAGVAASGVTRVSGDVVGDESAFDALRGPPSEGYRPSLDVGPLSALAFLHGRPGGARPARYVASVFREALRAAGVEVAGTVRAGAAQAGLTPLATLPSAPLGTVVRVMNLPSDNWYAETLIKALAARAGEPGTTANGARLVVRTLDALGVRPRVVDGSGLSREDRTTAAQVVRLLVKLAGGQLAQPFEDSLPVAARSGTLRERMRRSPAAGNCRAKTGTLRRVSNLAGYCESAGGGRTAFALLMNHLDAVRARRLQDRMAIALAQYAP